MLYTVKPTCEGVGQRSHDSRLVARFQYSPVTGWRRTDDHDDADGWFLPEDTAFRHEWAANTPGARHKITCKCGQSVELSYDNLIKMLDWARDNDEKLSIALIKKVMQARAQV